MAIIAVSAGAVAYLYLDLTMTEAAGVAAATFTGLALYHTLSRRLGHRSVMSRQLADLSRGGDDVARHVAEMDRRLGLVEARVETTIDHARAMTDPLASEVAQVGKLIKQLAEKIDAQQAMLETLASGQSKSEGVDGLPAVPASLSANADRTDKEHTGVAAGPVVDLAMIREAVDGNRIDIYLQPIVTLPQRKVRYYEATSQLRNEREETVRAAAFLAEAESAGLMPKIDNLVIFRCVQLVRRLLLKNRDIGVFCNLSPHTLTDATVLPQLLDFLAANRAIARSLVLQFSQSALNAMGPAEHDALAALSERGFHFSIDHVTALRLDPAEFADRGVRYVKVHANLLLRPPHAPTTDIRPAELSERLGRFGIDLIADRIEDERSVIDLLDHDVRFGQGSLFSPPRPVRPEAVQARPDLPHASAGERIAPAQESSLLHGPEADANACPETNVADSGTVADLAVMPRAADTSTWRNT
jgi:cyclic-di-GMP phosphodiesterase TipF (flagellum assembly factor)